MKLMMSIQDICRGVVPMIADLVLLLVWICVSAAMASIVTK
jgi:hypothetical protein